MIFNIISVFVFALFAKTISSQCIGAGYYGNNLNPAAAAAAAAYGNSLAYGPLQEVPEIAATFNGGGLQVTSYSPIAPSGITVHSDDLLIEGSLAVNGQMPFLGVVAVEGPLAAIGQGAVAYGCGNGNIGIVSEGLEGVAPEYATLGVASGLNGLSCANNGYAPRY